MTESVPIASIEAFRFPGFIGELVESELFISASIASSKALATSFVLLVFFPIPDDISEILFESKLDHSSLRMFTMCYVCSLDMLHKEYVVTTVF